MSDQITAASQQNDGSGNPLGYNFTYLFDDGNDHTQSQDVYISASTLDTPTDSAAALLAANILAKTLKAQWISDMAIPAPVSLPSLLGPVTLS